MDKAGRIAKLSAIAHKSQDPTLQIRSIEALNKMEDTATALAQTDDTDGLSEDRVIRDLMQLPGGAAAAGTEAKHPGRTQR